MRSNFDGSNRQVIISSGLYRPLGIAVDRFDSKLYWIDDEEGIHYKVEMSNLDGSERTVIVQDKHHEPVSLAVDRHNLYWTESVHNAVWKMKKKSDKTGDLPESFTAYDLYEEADPRGIVTRDNSGKIDCNSMIKEVKRVVNTSLPPPKPINQSFISNTTSVKDGKKELFMCFNGGLVDKTGSSCRCKPGLVIFFIKIQFRQFYKYVD